MAANEVDAEARDKLQPWLLSLRTAGGKGDMLKIYSDWTENYDADLLNGGYDAPVLTVKCFSESYPKESRGQLKILDIGAGTGLVARGLRSEGFCHIDALDASNAMLSIAKKDDLYENYFCEFISEKPLSCFEPDTYDGLTASGCFGPNHIPPEALHEVIRIVKPGGIVVIVARAAYLSTLPDFKDRLVPLINTLEKQGKWKKLLAETTGRYFLNDEAIIWKFQVL